MNTYEYFSCFFVKDIIQLLDCFAAGRLAAKCMRVAGSLLICNSSDSTTKSILPRDGCKPRPWIPCSIKNCQTVGQFAQELWNGNNRDLNLGEIWSCNQSNWLLNSFRQDARQWEGLLWNTSNRPSRGCVWKWISVYIPFPSISILAKISNGKIRPRMAISSQNMMISGNFPRKYGLIYLIWY